MNGTLSFYEYNSSGGNTMREWGHSDPTLCKKFVWTVCIHRQWGWKNVGCKHLRPGVSHLVEVFKLPVSSGQRFRPDFLQREITMKFYSWPYMYEPNWRFLTSDYMGSEMSEMKHSLSSVYVVIDLCVASTPIRFLHFIYPVSLGKCLMLLWAENH